MNKLVQAVDLSRVTELSRDPMEFQITIRPDEVEADDINNQDERLILKFELPRNYPDVVPIVTLFGPGLDEPTVDKAKAYLMEKAEENIGMVMCFLLASEAKEWLDARRKTLQEEMDAIDIDKLRLKAEEEAKFAGTPVTRENFVEWRDNFEKEIQGGVAGKATKDSNKAVKKTGRQMFETDKTMMVSDYGLMEEGDEDIDVSAERALAAGDVDESLFEEEAPLEFSEEDD